MILDGVGKIIDAQTQLEILRGDSDNAFYFDRNQLESHIKALPGGDGRWNALLQVLKDTDHVDENFPAADVVQRWLRHPRE